MDILSPGFRNSLRSGTVTVQRNCYCRQRCIVQYEGICVYASESGLQPVGMGSDWSSHHYRNRQRCAVTVGCQPIERPVQGCQPCVGVTIEDLDSDVASCDAAAGRCLRGVCEGRGLSREVYQLGASGYRDRYRCDGIAVG